MSSRRSCRRLQCRHRFPEIDPAFTDKQIVPAFAQGGGKPLDAKAVLNDFRAVSSIGLV
jgi:hypothetical protein